MLQRIRKKYKEKTQANNGLSSYIPYNELLKEGFFAGIGWAFGVTIGFVLISTLIVLILRHLGGLPIIGSWIADIVEETQNQLLRRTPVF